MKKLRSFCAASLLVGALSLSVFAGQIEIGYDPTPQPAPTPEQAQGEMSTTVAGTIHTGVAGDMHTTEAAAEGTLAGGVVDLVETVLSLL